MQKVKMEKVYDLRMLLGHGVQDVFFWVWINNNITKKSSKHGEIVTNRWILNFSTLLAIRVKMEFAHAHLMIIWLKMAVKLYMKCRENLAKYQNILYRLRETGLDS